jgi:hypothetical protein
MHYISTLNIEPAVDTNTKRKANEKEIVVLIKPNLHRDARYSRVHMQYFTVFKWFSTFYDLDAILAATKDNAA